MKFTLLTLGACLAAGMTAMAAPAGRNAFTLINDLRDAAAASESHALELQSIALTPSVSWQSNARQLDNMKKDINSMGATLAALEKMRDGLTPGEREQVNRALPLLKEMAADFHNAVKSLDYREETWLTSYRKPVDDMVAASGRLSKALTEFVQATKLRDKEQRLERDLGIAGF